MRANNQRANRRPDRKPDLELVPSRSTAMKAGSESGLVPITDLRVAPENDKVYRPISHDDLAIIELADSIRIHGIKKALVVSTDGYILSGHRRYAAARLAGLKKVPCRTEPVSRKLEPDRFLVLLTEYNRQREKSLDEKVREAAINVDPEDAYKRLIEERKRRAKVKAIALELPGYVGRAVISAAKDPFLEAVLRVLDELQDFLPISERQIHYNLLNNPPLKHASKPDSYYRNDLESSKALSDLVTRARIEGRIPEDAIGDETRPVVIWRCDRNVGDFIHREVDQFLKGYWRDPMQSQPNHVEVLVEKNTVANVLEPVAEEFGIPITSGRGFSSLPPRIAMKNRYETSGKEKLIIILVSDFDPSGEWIATSFARSMRDDFGLDIHPIKAALTYEQVTTINLPPSVEIKMTGTHYKAWLKKYSRRQKAYELEALAPAVLQDVVRRVIDGVIDRKLFNAEVRRMKEENQYLTGLRQTMHSMLKDIKLENRD